MSYLIFLLAALLLAIERVTYVWISRRPEQFLVLCIARRADPVDVTEALFRAFKVIQLVVFVGWCVWWGAGALDLGGGSAPVITVALGLLTLGQFLNFAVFRQLGRTGVFYGVRFGYDVPWCTSFPFSVLDHPQYLGTVLSIWGFFLLARHPAPDWIVLPLLETIYYGLGAHLESEKQ
jgi:methylene-fatty-acyl-phospholipid synthase